MPDAVKIMFNIDNESTKKARTTVNSLGTALVMKTMVILEVKEIYITNNADIYGTLKNLYLSEKESEKKLLHSIQSAPPRLKLKLPW